MSHEPLTYLTFDNAREILRRQRELAADAGTALFEPAHYQAIVARTADSYELQLYLEEFIASLIRYIEAQAGTEENGAVAHYPQPQG